MKRKFLPLIFVLFFSACGSGTVYNETGTTVAAPDGNGYYYLLSSGYSFFSTDGVTWDFAPGSSPNIPDQKTSVENVSDTTVTRQSMVSGDVSVADYQGGSIEVAIHEALACGQGYCPVEGKPPLASSSLKAPGYFSLVAPHIGQPLLLKATHVSSNQSSYQAQLYLGVLAQRKDGVSLVLKSE